jgi:hypothetical protein
MITLTGVICFGIQTPYHAYFTFIEDGIHGELLKVNKPNNRLLTGNLLLKNVEENMDTDKLWVNLEFGDYILPFPMSHPSIKIVPKPRLQGKTAIADFTYVNNKEEELLTFKAIDIKKSDFTFPTDRLFKLPLVKKYIQRKGRLQVWKDMFNRNLNLPKVSIFEFKKFKTLVKYVTPLDLAYNVYIYKMRERFFPKDVKNAYFINSSHIVFMIEAIGDDGTSKISRAVGRYLKNGKVYTYHLNISKDNIFSNLIRQRIFNSLKVEDSKGEFTSQKIYTEFKSLPFEQRISVDGLVYLYSAWSHELENKAFMRELIQFMERGKGHESFLFPLYEFSKKTWGTTFSTRDKYLEEDAQNRLRRGIEKEKKKEERDLENIDAREIDFKTKEDKIKFLLNKAKRKKREKKPQSSGQVIEN